MGIYVAEDAAANKMPEILVGKSYGCQDQVSAKSKDGNLSTFSAQTGRITDACSTKMLVARPID
jgi:hypothetical protein